MAQIFRDFAKITNQLIVGKHPGTVGDIDTLYVNNGVRAIENLQESWEDRSYIAKIMERCELKRIWYQRVPIHDQKPISVRAHLPVAVGILDKAISKKLNEPGQTVYLHCNEGLGRSPSVAAAYLYWFTDRNLDGPCNLLKEKRTHSTPYRDAILGATYDILERNNGPHNFEESPAETLSKISSDEKDEIKDYVRTKLPAVLDA